MAECERQTGAGLNGPVGQGMVDVSPKGYSASQVALHWLVAALVIFLFVTGDNTTEVFSAGLKKTATDVNWAWIPVHVVVGLVILGAMLWRLSLRWQLGAPEVPTSEPALLRWLASGVHAALYADMIAGAITGILAYFWLPGLAGVHDFLTRLPLLVLVVLHVAGALWHHFYWRDDVLKRMMKPLKSTR